MHTARTTFNSTVHKIESEKQKINFISLRNHLVPKHKIPPGKEWLLETPKDVRAESIREVVTAYKSAFANLKNGTIKYFKMKFRSRKRQRQEHINIPKTAIKVLEDGKKLKIYSRYMHSTVKLHHEQIPSIDMAVKIVHVKKCNLWYIHVPVKHVTTVLSENQRNTVAIDPGEKTFLTCYFPDGKLLKIGHEDLVDKILPILRNQDALKSVIAKGDCSGKTKYNLKRRGAKLRFRVKNLIKEVHNKAAQMLVKSASTIFLPRLAGVTKRMFSSACKRRLLCWSHSTFIDRLTYYCKKHGCKLLIVQEDYTSKTCGNCGHLHEQLGTNRLFTCPRCCVKIDRDGNAARNIFMKTCC